MRRGLLLFLNLGLLGTIAGCGRGVCDCIVYPLEHGTPSPIVKPASATGTQPIQPVPAANPPAPQQ
jgi:hypothetical protein